MEGRNFLQLLEGQWERGNFLCVGLDSDFEKIPEAARKGGVRETIVAFNRAMIDVTKEYVCAYKPNSAFYEVYGDEGWGALRETIQYIHEQVPEVPVILDAKRGDVGNTNEAYVRAVFNHLGADAVTVHPYFGSEALLPFFAREDKGVIVLCRSSNAGAGEIQDLTVDGEPVYRVVARLASTKWNSKGNCCVMVGATYPEELGQVRAIVGDMPILIPGIGAQNGDLEKTVKNGKDSRGRGIIICASRAVTFASSGADYAEAAGRAAKDLHDAIKKAL
ncbi:orotidine-5'-phosphate decarboxylase [Candidatus Kaiserbacteria bacterium]|nr:orotidine-5'-phosphate decarboxylase [Candidatus Kaiserbacteria bacterium]